MKHFLFAFALGILITACDTNSDESGLNSPEQIITKDLTQSPTYFKLSSGLTVDTWDLAFTSGNQSYLVDLNQDAGATVTIGDTGTAFETAGFPGTAYFASDTGTSMAIGASWMEMSTYNPTDHSIGGNGTIYFLRCADYQRIKFEVLSASPDEFQIRWAPENEDHTFGVTQTATVPYSSGEPAYWDFSIASTVTPEDWDLGLVSLPITIPGAGTFYMPSVQLNLTRVIRFAILPDTPLDSFEATTENITWVPVDELHQPLGYGGDNEILVYHPEPPYNHKVIVEHPEQLLLIETPDGQYKIQFQDYGSGVVVFLYGEV
ncbi:MAG: hypothetical protein GXO90_04830 [FCB group bacterium]|nr:hypothetical protein [FCB group bacterium]